MLAHVHHVQITIPRGAEDEARRYYCRLLGLHEIDKPESLRSRGGLWLQLNGFQVHIGTEDGFDRLTTKAHVAYQVTSLAEIKQKLLDAEYEVIDGIPVPGMSRFESRDPFGNRIEFLELTST